MLLGFIESQAIAQTQAGRRLIVEAFAAYEYVKRLIQMHLDRQKHWKRKFHLPDLKLSFSPHQLCLWPRIPDACAGLCIATPPQHAASLQNILKVTGGAIPITSDEVVKACRQASHIQKDTKENYG